MAKLVQVPRIYTSGHCFGLRSLGVLTAVIVTLTLAFGCHEDNAAPSDGFSLRLRIVDETNEPVPKATVRALGQSLTCDKNGQVELRLRRPAVVRVSGTGFLEEVALFGWESDGSQQTVRLLANKGGRRIVLHFGGDVMFGRRYLDPTEGEPLLELGDEAAGAKAVVSDLAEAFSAADLGVVNLETVVGRLADSLAYPGKRFLLQSPPDSLAALPYMGVDVVSLANNHTRDWLEPGLEDTLFAIDAAGLERVGAGLTEAEAYKPLVVQVGSAAVGFASFTSVTGSFVNDSYPEAQDALPSELSDKDDWLYEQRLWGIDLEEWLVPTQPRRIGEVWQLYSDIESNLSDESRSLAWSSMAQVFPELQDWVARRGHGGAASWSTSASAKVIADLTKSADIVVVQLHSGYQFSAVASSTLRSAAHAAVDAGADIVIAHHPHVLQGFEWYDGHLIVHSLGNFIFDQDFLATFDAGFIRAVFEDGELLEARFVPTTLASYRPVPVVDAAARRSFARLLESSSPNMTTERDSVTSDVRVFFDKTNTASSPGLTEQWGTALLAASLETAQAPLELPAQVVTRLSDEVLWPGQLGADSTEMSEVLVGRELLGYGGFEPLFASDLADCSAQWVLDHHDEQTANATTPRGRGFLRLHRDDKNESSLTTRPVARIPLPTHRLYTERTDEPAQPADPEATYSLVMMARSRGIAKAALRLDFYHFDDTNPSEDPESVSLGRSELPLIGLTEAWSQIQVDVELPHGNGVTPNMAMVYFILAPPLEGEADLEVDDLSFVEWRAAAQMPSIYGSFTYAWSPRSISKSVEVRRFASPR